MKRINSPLGQFRIVSNAPPTTASVTPKPMASLRQMGDTYQVPAPIHNCAKVRAELHLKSMRPFEDYVTIYIYSIIPVGSITVRQRIVPKS
jgi:hypothetical protein